LKSVSRRLAFALLGGAALLTACACKTETAAPATAPPRTDAGWELVWADEFEQDGRPNPRNWTCEAGFVRNEELQWYQEENARCENGMLVIEARRERKANPHYNPVGKDWATSREYASYTSASLTTRGLHQWRYGRFEMRGRIDTRGGLWPAFWTLGVSGEWPHSGEVDVMEYYGGTLLANAFWGGRDRWVPRSSIRRIPLERFQGPRWSNEFHVWRMDWDEEAINISADDVPLTDIDLSKTFNADEQGGNPLRQPHYLLLSLAVGGTQGGDPSETTFPARFEVDYVRVYQRARGG
jgi:beta-glucanase (GH16 family)